MRVAWGSEASLDAELDFVEAAAIATPQTAAALSAEAPKITQSF